jgi:hypothetical protein
MLYLLGQFLEGATREQDLGGSASEPPWRAVARDGLEVRRQVVERAYEGYVAKDEGQRVRGGPTRRWLKMKQKGGPSRRTAGRGGSAWRRRLTDHRLIPRLADAGALG